MITKYKKIVIKIGSSSIINSKTKKINTKWMNNICEDIEKYHKEKKNYFSLFGSNSTWFSLNKKK